MQKDKTKGRLESNHRPITYLPLVWKLTGIMVEEICAYLETQSLLTAEQEWCRKKSRSANERLFIDKMILHDVKYDGKIYPCHG